MAAIGQVTRQDKVRRINKYVSIGPSDAPTSTCGG